MSSKKEKKVHKTSKHLTLPDKLVEKIDKQAWANQRNFSEHASHLLEDALKYGGALKDVAKRLEKLEDIERKLDLLIPSIDTSCTPPLQKGG